MLVAGGGTPSALAAKAATATIPIVFAIADDPAKLGLVASLNRPGGNATGVNFMVAELGSKQLGLLHELVPAAIRIGLLVNPNMPLTESVARDVIAAASAIGVQIEVVAARDSREIEAAFATFVRNRADALLVGPDAVFLSRRLQLAILAARHREPWYYYGIIATVGSLIGSYITYRIARKAGLEYLNRKFGERKIAPLLKFFKRWGSGTLVVTALLPVPLPTTAFVAIAGALDYPLQAFMVIMTVCRAIRYGALAAVGSHYRRELRAPHRSCAKPDSLMKLDTLASSRQQTVNGEPEARLNTPTAQTFAPGS